MARCEECLHFEVCEALEQGNGLMKVSPIHCGYYKNAADVVPKSEYDAVVNAVDNSTKEFLKLHDAFQEQKVELEAMRGAANSYKMHHENLVREIMRKVRQELLNMVLANAMGEAYDIEKRFAEIEKKYTEGKG